MTISTPAFDRENDRVLPEGGDFANFLKNPVLCWGHDYKLLPIGRVTEIQVIPGKAVKASWSWLENDPFAERVRNAFEQGALSASSIGFIPKESKPNDEGGRDITAWEMLELTLCTVPMNPQAVRAMKAVLDAADALEVTDKAVPANVSTKKAPIGEAWSAPSLQDFTSDAWGDLSDAQRRHIAGHFAWADSLPPKTYGDLHLPHHRPRDGAVVFRGVAAAAARLNQTQGVNQAAVKAHLGAHYRAFKKTPPWEGSAALAEHIAQLKADLSHRTTKAFENETGDIYCATSALNTLQCLVASESMEGEEHAALVRQAAELVLQFLSEEFAEQFGDDGSGADGKDDDGDDMMGEAEPSVGLDPLQYPFVSATAMDGKTIAGHFIPADVFPTLTKRGRVLSAANEAKLKNAHAHLKAAHDTVSDVLENAAPMDQPPSDDDRNGDNDGPLRLSLADDDDPLWLSVVDEKTWNVSEPTYDPHLVTEILRDLVPHLIRDEVGHAVTDALTRARGGIVD